MEKLFEWGFKYLLPGDFIVLGIFVTVTWFFYRNFGRKIMAEIKSQIAHKMAIDDCKMMREQCQVLLQEKRERLKDNLELEITSMGQKLDLLLERQREDMERFGRFLKLNGK